MKKINFRIILAFTVSFAFFLFSCEKDDSITSANTPLGEPIPTIIPEADYLIGAFYKDLTVANWSTTPERSTLGDYAPDDMVAFEQHVAQAEQGGVDYFLFDMTTSANIGNHPNDIAYVDLRKEVLTTLNTNVKYAFNYDIRSLVVTGNNDIDAGSDPTNNILGVKETTFQEDFIKFVPYFKDDNYMKVDGKAVVYMYDSHNTSADDHQGVYNRLRERLRSEDVELYLVGSQTAWTPPLRYAHRFSGLDASTHYNYLILNNTFNQYQRINFVDKMSHIAWTYHQEALNRPEIGMEYIPTISPSITPTRSAGVDFPKDETRFRNMCNAAKDAAGSKRMIFVDSFNDWTQDTQIESAESYGDTYLNILKDEMKVKVEEAPVDPENGEETSEGGEGAV